MTSQPTRTSEPVITVVGSANTDMIVAVPQLPLPGETVLGGDLVTAGGGKGANQAVAARRLGAEVNFVARLGNDALGEQALASYRSAGVRTERVKRDAQAPSGVALILVQPDGENVIAVAAGANARLSADDVRQAADAIAESDVLIVQMEVPLATVHEALRIARAAGVRTILNPAPAPREPLPDEIVRLASVLNPNRGELARLTGLAVTNLESVRTAAETLLARGVEAVVVTLGAEGAMLVTGDGAQTVSAYQVDSVDAVGAGDAFTAGLAVALGRGEPIEQAVDFANAVAALATTKPGAQPSAPTADEVAAFRAARG
jgi:ribokinase